MAEGKKHRVALKSFTGKNLLSISAWIEETVKEREVYYSDIVFVELSEGYQEGKKLSMVIDATELRKMSYAIKAVLKNGTSKYEKYTDPKLAGAGGAKKRLDFTRGDVENYFLNLKSGGDGRRFVFDPFAFAAFGDSILLIAQECERELYRFQRHGGSARASLLH
jgi:hypothetical protein